ncbi:MAG TPA: tryptophan-rich sensory protein [Flavobacterium sp.]|uniref:TspO/MBR family protein n=1 Tax=unclassified Flavobacterium TaxID=196869 RepID=UPI000E90506C|nr:MULTISPECIES: TspO/MBR family protein [unclassified Flavobacterium]HBI01682.1 sensory protein TspO [Flavobacterium sp.]HRE77521.1 tryptophan-rich sensory protein [Flavobacterium sp.]
MSKIVKIAIAVAICLGVGYGSSLVTQSSITTWYPTINKPSFNPPNEVFAPVWTILYVMMGVSAGLIWSKMEAVPILVKKALWVFMIQLILNALWSFLFFGLQNSFLALVEIMLLWLMIFETIKLFKPIDALASKLMIPYLLWVSFAMILNGSIWWLNR